MRKLTRRLRDERGVMLIMAGLGLMAFLSATMLALDVGMIMVARSQAQNAADAGALAGAVALVYDDWDDRTAGGPAVQNAINAATADANGVIRKNVSVKAEDVTFPEVDRVRVVVHRTAARNNPLKLFLGQFFGIDQVNMGAEAIARAAPANAMTCVKPFTIPDKWIEMQTPPWDPDDTFDVVDKKGNPLTKPDIYIPPKVGDADQPDYTGYNAERDRGTRVVIKAANGDNLYPSFYFPYAMGDSEGADDYRWNIANCNQTMMGYGERLTAEPGNMVGPTKDGVTDLVNKDPLAYWDKDENRVVSNMHPSPRVVPIPVFDPVFYDIGKQNGRNADLKVANYVGIFIEGMDGNNVIARITPVSGLLKGNAGPAPAAAFPRAIVLVK